MPLTNRFHEYRAAMLALPADRSLTKADLLVDEFLIERHGPIETYYAPHNEYVNLSARVVIVGITTGWNR